MNPHDPTKGQIDYGESKVKIEYYTEPDPILLTREEGTEEIDMYEFCNILEKHQEVLIEAWEYAKEQRQRIESLSRPDPVTSYMNDLLDEMSRSDADTGL